MIFPDVTPDLWMKKHKGLNVEKEKCVICNRMRIANVPFIKKDCIGFVAAPCLCGQPSESFGVTIYHDNRLEVFVDSILGRKE